MTGAVLIDNNPWFVLELNAEAAFTITGLWMLAARSRRTLIHLPLRGKPPPEPSLATVPVGELDLVLSHYDLQFAPNRWKQLRHRLGAGAPHTISWNPNDVPAWDEVHELNRQARRRSFNRDRFHQRLHAHTLFMAGNAVAFRRTARYVLDMALQRPVRREGWRRFPAEHRGAYLVDVARAYLRVGDVRAAARALVDADSVAPAEARCRPWRVLKLPQSSSDSGGRQLPSDPPGLRRFRCLTCQFSAGRLNSQR